MSISKTKVKIIPYMNWIKQKSIKGVNLKGLIIKIFILCTHLCNQDDKNNIIGVTEHEKFKFCSILKKNNIIGLQFHPEKSGSDGLNILREINKLTWN